MEPDAPGSAKPAPPTPPLTQALLPRPAVVFIALLLALLLGFHVVYDALSDSYDNSGVTFLLGAMVLTTFGVPLGKALKDLQQ